MNHVLLPKAGKPFQAQTQSWAVLVRLRVHMLKTCLPEVLSLRNSIWLELLILPKVCTMCLLFAGCH